MGRLLDEFTVGQRFETPGRTITEADIVIFSGLTGDYNPVHTDEVFAQATEFGARVAHGPMGIGIAFGLAARLDLFDGTVMALLGVQWDFTAPMRIGETIKALIEIREIRPTRREDRGILRIGVDIVGADGTSLQNGEATLLMRRKPHPGARWGALSAPAGTVV